MQLTKKRHKTVEVIATLAAIVLSTITTSWAAGAPDDKDGSVSNQKETAPHRQVQAKTVYVKSKSRPYQSATTVSQLGQDIIKKSRNTNLADMLSLNTPLYIKSNGLGSAATASFRGTAPSHTTIEWNGIPINSPMVGYVDLSLIPAAFIDRVELLHGGSSLRGRSGTSSGSLGGTIAISSLPRWGEKIYGGYTQNLGSFGQLGSYATLGGGGKRLQVRARYMWEQARNDFEYLNTAIPPFQYVRQQNAGYRKQGAAADIHYKVNDHNSLTLNAWWHTAYRNMPPIMSYEGLGRIENQQDDELRAVLHWNHYDADGRYTGEFTAAVSSTTMNYLLRNKTEVGYATNVNSRSSSQSYTAKYRFEWRATRSTLLKFNVDATHHSVATYDSTRREGYDARRTDLGISASVDQNLVRDKLSGYLLLRQSALIGSNGKILSTPFIPSLGLEYRPLGRSHDLSIYTNATRNYHSPTLNDLYWMPGGNPELLPERGYTFDLGTRYGRQIGDFGIKATLAGYMSMIDNWIIWQPSDYSYWSAENLKSVFARGVESSLTVDYSLPGIRSQIILNGNYAYTRTTNQSEQSEGDASIGRQLIYIPEHKANASIELNYNRRAWISYRWNYTSERYTTSSNETQRYSLPAYDTSDISVGGSLPLWRSLVGELQFTVANLFNRQYQTTLWRAAAPRNYNIQITIKF